MLHQIDRQLGRLAGLFAVVGSLGIVILLGVTVVAVFWRYMLNAPIFGIEDISIVTLTLVAAGSVAYGARHGAHVAINLISGLTQCCAIWSMFKPFPPPATTVPTALLFGNILAALTDSGRGRCA